MVCAPHTQYQYRHVIWLTKSAQVQVACAEKSVLFIDDMTEKTFNVLLKNQENEAQI